MSYSCKSYLKYVPVLKDGSRCKPVRSYEYARAIIDSSDVYKHFEVVRVYPAFHECVVESICLPTIFVDVSDLFSDSQDMFI